MKKNDDYQPVFHKEPQRFQDFAIHTLLFVTGQELREIVRHSEQLILVRFDILQLQFGASEDGCYIGGPAYPGQSLSTQDLPIEFRPEWERLHGAHIDEQVKAVEIISSPDREESVGIALTLEQQVLTFFRDGSRAALSSGRIPNVTQTFFNDKMGPSAICYHIYPYKSMAPEEFVAKTRDDYLIGTPLTHIQAGRDVAPEDPLYKWAKRVHELLLDW